MSVIFSKAHHLMRARVLFKHRIPARGAVLLDQDWMPGPYPKNEKERSAAAKKYNLLREEYEPTDPKWDIGMGDYPVLPNRCFEEEDPYDDYVYMADARHYGMPVHHAWEVLQANSMQINYTESVDYIHPINGVLVTWIVVLAVFWYTEYVKNCPNITKMKPQHRPGQGVVHYHYPTSDLHMY